MSGEVNSLTHCSAFTAVASCQTWWKFVNKVIAKNMWLTFRGHGV